MSIKKILLLASMALAAIAFAAPAVAQANVTLTEGTEKIEQTRKVTATSTNLVTTTESGNLECAKVTLHLEVVKNGNEHVELKQLGAAATEGCVLATPIGNFPTTVADGTAGVGNEGLITINTWGTGNTTATFLSTSFSDPAHTEPIAACHFEGNLHLTATNGTDELHVNGTLSRTVGEESCPSETGHMHGMFTLETSGGVPVTIDFLNTP